MTVNKRAVHAAGNSFCIFGNWLRVCRIGGVEKGNAVLAVGCAFPGNHQNLAVCRGADVIDESRVDFDRVRKFRMRRV